MLYVTISVFFISMMLFAYFVLISFNKNKIEMTERISAMESLDRGWTELDEDYGESVGALIFKSLGSFLLKLSPGYKSKRTRDTLEKAGVLKHVTSERWVARKAVTTFLVAFFVGLGSMILAENIVVSLVMALLAALIVHVSYRFYLSRRITRRTTEIVRAIPYTLDLITVSVEAGLSLDGAIGRIVSAISGPLSDEFGQTLKEMRMGIEKKEALKNMGERVGNKDLSMILSSIVQADELGVSLGKILRIEGAQLREKRKQAAREKAMKAPVKILFPLILFIFPTIFMVVLGPAIIKIVEVF
ncbi:type II secretion system F family protein [Acidaminobacter sp. JC074]|uniref:type II secretion system F family protein n=1 Tax=Acidaminobacter sp. JC074 TaxID=2530199 RepID=UPI001F0D8A76|nr:type II secretion system F family protein [Acidaminobacter sp. JC074]MCH4890442.1 type II secretion system F family protein [Acidaminobacter sp. JC074]